jgi:segregation and condensation protein A
MKESRTAKKPAASKKAVAPAESQGADTELPADGGVRIALPGFEGPLDLLLHLIQEHELDILNIPIAFITKKYLEYMEMMKALNIDIASEYLVMAATLAHIKSRSLLPAAPADVDEEEEEELDPRAELIKRLLEYQKYKKASEELAARSVLGRDIFVRGPQPAADPLTAPLAPVSSFKLLEAFQRVLSRTKVVIDHEVEFERFSLSDRINHLVDFLKGKGRVTFEELFEGQVSRPDLIVTFLALLELTRLRMIQLFQQSSLETIYVEMIGEDAGTQSAQEELSHPAEPARTTAAEPEPPRSPPRPDLLEEEELEEEEEFDVAAILAEAAAEEAEEKRLAEEARLREAQALGLSDAETSVAEAPGVDVMSPSDEATIDARGDDVSVSVDPAIDASGDEMPTSEDASADEDVPVEQPRDVDEVLATEDASADDEMPIEPPPGDDDGTIDIPTSNVDDEVPVEQPQGVDEMPGTEDASADEDVPVEQPRDVDEVLATEDATTVEMPVSEDASADDEMPIEPPPGDDDGTIDIPTSNVDDEMPIEPPPGDDDGTIDIPTSNVDDEVPVEQPQGVANGDDSTPFATDLNVAADFNADRWAEAEPPNTAEGSSDAAEVVDAAMGDFVEVAKVSGGSEASELVNETSHPWSDAKEWVDLVPTVTAEPELEQTSLPVSTDAVGSVAEIATGIVERDATGETVVISGDETQASHETLHLLDIDERSSELREIEPVLSQDERLDEGVASELSITPLQTQSGPFEASGVSDDGNAGIHRPDPSTNSTSNTSDDEPNGS